MLHIAWTGWGSDSGVGWVRGSGVAWGGAKGPWPPPNTDWGGPNYQMAPPNNETLKNMCSFVGIFYFFAVHAQILQLKKSLMHSHALKEVVK